VRRLLVYGLLSCVLGLLLYAFLHSGTPDGVETALGPDDERDATRESSLLTSSGEEPGGTGGPGLAPRALPDAPSNEDKRGPVTVRVVGADGKGLPSVFVGLVASKRDLRWIEFYDPFPVRDILESDRQGEVVYRDLPYDGSVSAVVCRQDPGVPQRGRPKLLPRFGLEGRGVPIRGERVRFHASAGVRLQVQAVEAETGRPVPRARVSINDAHGASADAARGSALLVWPVEEKNSLLFSVEAPDGRLAWDVRTWAVQISPYAKSLKAYYPLRREVGVSLTVLEPDRRPTPKPVVFDVRAAGRLITATRCASDGYGRLRITGVPFLPGETLSLKARRDGGVVQAGVTDRIPADADAELDLEITLPPEPANASLIGIGGSAGTGAFRGRGGSRDLGFSGRHARPKGSVVVIVRRRNASPAQGARVYLGDREARTDLNGRAHFARVHPGEYAVRVQQVGLLPLSGKVIVRGEEQARLVLREGAGGRLEVQVVDDEGRPLTYARLQVKTASGQPWIDLQDGVQRVDPFTDHEGRRVLHGIEPGAVSIVATWGSRKTQVQVQADSGQGRPVEIVLAP